MRPPAWSGMQRPTCAGRPPAAQVGR